MWGNFPHTAPKYYPRCRVESIGKGHPQVGHHPAVGATRGAVTIEGGAVVRAAPAGAGHRSDAESAGLLGQVLAEIQMPWAGTRGREATPAHHFSPYFVARASDADAAVH